jgi:DNA topoisomerase-3
VCGFVLPRTVCKREITREEFLVYLRTGKTELLEDFTSRLGRPFSATLVLKESGRHGFEFPPRKSKGAGKGRAAAGTKRAKTTRRKTTTKKPSREKTSAKKTTRKKAVARSTTPDKVSP